MLCIFIQFRKKLVFSMVLRFSLFGKNIILPNLQGILRCFRSVKPVFYAAHSQCMQCHAVVAIMFLAARAISHGARWYMGVVSFSVSGCTPPPLPPRGAGKTGRLSGDSPCATTHSLLRLPAKHRPARCYLQVTCKLLASYSKVSSLSKVHRKFIESSSHYVFTSFQRNSIHYLGDMHLVFTTFDAIL